MIVAQFCRHSANDRGVSAGMEVPARLVPSLPAETRPTDPDDWPQHLPLVASAARCAGSTTLDGEVSLRMADRSTHDRSAQSDMGNPGSQLTPRVARLREQALGFEDSLGPGYRLHLVTEFYRSLPDPKPAPVLLHAQATKYILERVPVKIFPGERIVGQQFRYLFCHGGISDKRMAEWQKGIEAPEKGFSGSMAPDMPQPYRSDLEFWQGHKGAWQEMWREQQAASGNLNYSTLCDAGGYSAGHLLFNYGLALREGLLGPLTRAAKLESTSADPAKRDFHASVRTVLEGATTYCTRHARLARELASQEADAARRAELEAIAENCEGWLESGAKTFHGALQATWLLHRISEVEAGDIFPANSFGRLDQFLWPYYLMGDGSGPLAEEEAIELLEEFFVKFIRIYDDQNVMLGGKNADGSSAVSELTYLIMEAYKRLDYPYALVLRLFSGMPERYLDAVTDLMLLGRGVQVFNDETCVPAIMRAGYSHEDASQYAVTGCVEFAVAGIDNPRPMAIKIALHNLLLLALNGGRSLETDEQLGLVCKAWDEYSSFEELRRSFYQRVREVFWMAAGQMRVVERYDGVIAPLAFHSTFVPSCMETGVDFTSGGAKYDSVAVVPVGIATTVDSLEAVRKLVFEEKSVTLGGLREALRDDFAGHDGLRGRLKRCPKYGNNHSQTDALACDLIAELYRIISAERTHFGGPYRMVVLSTTSNSVLEHPFNRLPTPDGRRAHEQISMSLAPSPWAISKGLTSTVLSAASIDNTLFSDGAAFVLEAHPSNFQGEEGRNAMKAVLQAFIGLGLMSLAINILDVETLKEALRNPEAHSGIRVRLFGYSDYFSNLSEKLKLAVIERAERGGG